MNTKLPYGAILPLVFYSREMKAYVHIKTYTQMLIVALFCNSQSWKLSRCLTGEWMNKVLQNHTTSHKLQRKHSPDTHMMWMNLKNTKVSQGQGSQAGDIG